MTESVDLAVVGASFAGLAAARTAASRGLETMVIDRKPEPGARVHTTGLLVKEAAEELTVPHHLTRRIRGVRLYAPSGRTLDLDRPGYYFLATDTAGLMRWLTVDARTMGARVRFDAPFRDVWFDEAKSRRRAVSINDNTLHAEYLLGADGPRSAVAKACGFSQNRRFLTGVEAEFTGVNGVDPDRLHVFIDPRIAPGYIAWLVPGVNGITQVGLARRHPGTAPLDAFLERCRGLFDFRDATRIGMRGGLIPVGGRLRTIGAPHVMLTGDAAGLVSPLTAGGIHTAVRYGRAAAHAIGDHLQCGGPDPARALRAALPSFIVKRQLRRLMNVDAPTAMIDAMFALAPFRAMARLIFFHHRGLFSWHAWHDLLRGRVDGGSMGVSPTKSTIVTF